MKNKLPEVTKVDDDTYQIEVGCDFHSYSFSTNRRIEFGDPISYHPTIFPPGAVVTIGFEVCGFIGKERNFEVTHEVIRNDKITWTVEFKRIWE